MATYQVILKQCKILSIHCLVISVGHEYRSILSWWFFFKVSDATVSRGSPGLWSPTGSAGAGGPTAKVVTHVTVGGRPELLLMWTFPWCWLTVLVTSPPEASPRMTHPSQKQGGSHHISHEQGSQVTHNSSSW